MPRIYQTGRTLLVLGALALGLAACAAPGGGGAAVTANAPPADASIGANVGVNTQSVI